MASTDNPGDMQSTLDALSGKKKQTSFDQTNLPAQYQTQSLEQAAPGGPIGRASQQLQSTPAATGQSLRDAYQPGTNGKSAIYSSVGAHGETSFSSVPNSLESMSPGFQASNSQTGQPPAPQTNGLAQAWRPAAQSASPAPTSLEDLTPGGRPAPAAPKTASSLADANLSATPRQALTSFDQFMPGTSSAAAQPISQPASLTDARPGGPVTAPASSATPPSAMPGLESFRAQQPAQAAQPASAHLGNIPLGIAPTATSPTYPTSSQQPGGLTAQQASDAAKAQATISQSSLAAASLVAPKQTAQPAPIGVLTTATSPKYPIGQQAASVAANQPAPAPTQPEAPTPAPSGYQQTGVGTGSNQIAMKIGDDGVPMFTNDAAAVAGAVPASANQANRASPVDPNQSLASLGSIRNMGDGVGTFSQASQGDAQLAMGRWQKAADLRSAYRAQDRLEQAQGEKWQADHTNVVHDSSRPVTRRELKTDADYAAMKDRAARNVDLAQGYLNDQQANQQTGMQLRQAQRLEDALTMATAPNATVEQKQAYQTLTDPTNEKGLARQLTQAKINEANASADKQRNSINKTGNLPVGLQKLEDGDIDAVSNVQSTNTQLTNILGQLDDGSLVLGPIENRKNAARNASGNSNAQSVNYASFMSSLEQIRNANLRLNKGTQTEGDANRAWNELIANVNDPKVVKQRLQEIQAMNNKAAQTKLGMINSRRKNQGVAPLNIEDILGGSPLASQPEQAQQTRGTAAPAKQAGQGESAQAPGIPQIKSDDDYNKLPSGTQFIDPQGMHRRKP